MRAKLVLAAFMAVATAATGMFIHVRLSQKPRAPMLAESVAVTTAEAAPSAPEAAAPQPSGAEAAAQPEAGGLVIPIKPTIVRTVAIPSPDADGVDGDGLGEDDPRWGRAENGEKTARSSPQAKSEPLAFADPESPVVETDDLGISDDSQTAAIPPVAIIPAARPQAKAELDTQADADDAPAATGKAAGRSAQIARAVNMRSSPRSGSKVIRVLPRGASVGLVGCSGWCEVTYQGSRGFIYRSFLSGGGNSAGTTKTRAVQKKTTAAEAPKKPETLLELLSR